MQSNDKKKAGVLVIHELQKDVIILTQRTEHLRSHPGEICFPGGSQDFVDADLYHTALRETFEEIGVEPERFEFLSQLAIEMTLTGFEVYPWLVRLNGLEPYRLNAQEIQKLVLVPRVDVCNYSAYQQIDVRMKQFKLKTWQFSYDDEFIWGATARIMKQLAQEEYSGYFS